MAKLTDLSNKKLYILRYLSYWLYVISTIGIPIILVSWQFEIFKKPGGLQITAYGVILVIIVLFVCRGHLKRAITEMETGIIKTVIINTGKILPWFACWFVLAFLSDTSFIKEKVQFILFWTVVGNALAALLDVWHTALYKECKHRE